MSALQALKLLKFVKGVTHLYTPWNPIRPDSRWQWLLQINEAGLPFNMTIGIYKKKYRNTWGVAFFYVYFLGWRWFKMLDKKN